MPLLERESRGRELACENVTNRIRITRVSTPPRKLWRGIYTTTLTEVTYLVIVCGSIVNYGKSVNVIT